MAKHLTLEERDRIAHLKSRGSTQAAIAKALGRSPSVISREVRWNHAEDGMYYGGVASIPVILLSCGSGGHLKEPPSGRLTSLFVQAGIGILFLGIYAYMSHRATTATSTLPHDESG